MCRNTYILILLLYFCSVLDALSTDSTFVENPVIANYKYHDCSLIQGTDGFYYSFASCVAPRDTTNIHSYYNISIFRSLNLQKWEFYRYALPDSLMQNSNNLQSPIRHKRKFKITKEGNIKTYEIWAPDVIFFNGKYLMFVALHKNLNDTKIALFESNSLSEDFRFVKVVISNDKNDGYSFFDSREQIDPYPIQDGKRLYLVFGSFSRNSSGQKMYKRQNIGVYITELDPDNGYLMKYQPVFLTDYYEGVSIIRHKNIYYLFGTNGNLKNNSYKISYAKSKSLLGPYINDDNKSIGDTININWGHPILVTSKNARYNGFGCPSKPITDKKGRMWVLLLGHDQKLPPIVSPKASEERYTFLAELLWDKSGNPYFDVEAILNNKQIKPQF